MIMVISFAAFQATRDLMDLIVLFGVGLIGILLKRFGWSRPAFLIGFVLAPQAEGYLNLAVQFYGWQMLLRPGVVVILLIAVVSIWLGARGGYTDTEPATDTQTGQVLDRRPQILFLAGVAALSLYAIWSSQRLSPLGSMFPMSVALVTLGLAIYLTAKIGFGPTDNPLNFDIEASLPVDTPRSKRLWPNISWFAVLTVATGLLGFVLATLVFFLWFLRAKARAAWPMTLALTAAAVAVLSLLTRGLLVELPRGLLQTVTELPWPFG